MYRMLCSAAALALAGLGNAAIPANSVQIVNASGGVRPAYAEIAERVLNSPLLISATIARTTQLKGPDALGTAPGHARFYVEADVTALIRGSAGLPARINYLADVPLDARGRAPKLKKMPVLLFARPVPGQPGAVQLTAPDAQMPLTTALDALVRRIAREVVAPDAAPAITGIGNAFHVAGSLPGEGETQVFLTSEARPGAAPEPVSLSILRRPGEQVRWAVSLSEIVDEAAAPPARDTLLWYRLACGLPAALPERATASMDPADAAIAREDYQFVRQSLGPCRS